jgi:hypothetical protein
VPSSLGIYSTDAGKAEHRGVIYAIGPSPLSVNMIWTGSDDGAVHVTRDGGATWADVTPPELTPWSKVTQIDASHFDPQTAYVSVSRFRVDDLTPLVFRTRDGGKTWTRITDGMAANASVNVVREDPKAKGLLFAGTEREVYVSFDDGDEWQPLTLNLPHSSVRDLIVKGDDIAVATHGRGFWILDNMTLLRELRSASQRSASQRSAKALAERPAILFKPQVAYRLRRNQNPDTPLPPEIPAARNPPDGAIVDYYLPADASGPVTLEIFTSTGQGGHLGPPLLVRRYSSDDKPEPYDEKEINVPMYWARPLESLPASKGAHRFVWNLRYPTPGAVNRDFPISAAYRDTPLEPLGVLAVPGTYTVKLTVNGTTLTQPLTLKMDPRASITPLGLQQQFTLATQVAGMMNRTYTEISRQPAGSSRDALVTLNNDLATAYDVAEGADRAPTTQALRAVAELQKRFIKLVK